MTFHSESERFAARVVDERDKISAALHRDRYNKELQGRIDDWRAGRFPEDEDENGKVLPEMVMSGFFPSGETMCVIDTLYPRSGESIFEACYRKAIAEISQLNAATHFLPKIDRLKRSHGVYVDEAIRAYQESKREDSMPSWGEHNDAINDFISCLTAIQAGIQPKHPEPKPADEQPKNAGGNYRFLERGATFEICFEGQSVSLPTRQGFEVIRLLLSNPGKILSTEVLTGEKKIIEGGNINGQTAEEYQNAIETLESEYGDRSTEAERKDEIEQQLKSLRGELAKITKPGGVRNEGSTARASDSVRKNIDNAKLAFRKHLPSFAQYLEENLKTVNGQGRRYTGKESWQTD